ncbi:MAG: hypothetical protein M1839_008321 [Geoglossum umbratile]|nr:MAG: hypothetical protein M1839_008321 [Geoglossum umbratile]
MADPTCPATNTPSIPSGSTAPTTLGSGSQSRRQGSLAESAASNVDTTNPFRQGFPNPLRPLPQANFVVDAQDAESINWKLIQAAGIGYMEDREITWNTVAIINHRNPRHEPSPGDLTILITAPHDAASDSWYLMLQDLQGSLQDHGLTHLRAEIMDSRFARMPDHCVVESGHLLVNAWPGIDNIPENNPITILITTPDPPHLYPIIAQVEWICKKAGFTLKAEVLEGSHSLAMDNPDEVTLDESSFANPILMGSSISPQSIPGSRVTNFYIMRTKSFPQMYADNGLRPDQSSNVNIQAVVPSNQDYEFNLKNDEAYLKGAIEGPLAKARERWEMLGEERDKERIQLWESRKKPISQLVKELKAFNRDAGNLWAASGFRIHPQTQFGIDWALVKFLGNRPTPNMLLTDEEFLALGAPELIMQLSVADAKLEDAINPRVQLDRKICSAWQVVGQHGKPFCKKGDSGSFIIDSVGRWCAMLFASPYEDAGDAYVLPVDILIADIENMTGGTVSFP